MLVKAALLDHPYATLTYAALEEFPGDFWKEGLRVLVPLRKQRRVALLLGRSREEEIPSNVTIKPLLWPLETEPLVRSDLFSLLLELGKRQGEALGKIARALLLAPFRSADIFLQSVEKTGSRLYTPAELSTCSPEERARLARDMQSGTAKIVLGKKEALDEERYVLNCDPPWPVRPFAKLQIAVLDYLANSGPSSRKNLTRALGTNPSQALKTLLQKTYIVMQRSEETFEDTELLPPKGLPFSLNSEQRACVEALKKPLLEQDFFPSLLYGITGSGKTAVYLELAITCLESGRSVLLLVPEVAIAMKLMQDAKTLYPHVRVLLYHGYQTNRERETIWRECAEKRPLFVIGTRSALFLPLFRLGALFLDEEHDASFKQDEGVTYHAKEIAWVRAKENNALFLLGSATPDIRTFYAVKMGKIPCFQLTKRISGRALPPIELVSVREPKMMSEAVTLLSKKSLGILEETVRRGEQAVILINRRGYSPNLYCLDCGKVEHCPECEIALTFHKARGRLVCHYCGYSRPYPSPCSTCGAASFLPLGEGTERLSEELAGYFGQNVLRLDRDSTVRQGRMEEILKAFAREEAQILVGTQMLSKGHHFPKVTLVIAADADMGLNFPDYRASERTFQLLLQSAGRAGRGELEGRVLLQTHDESHYCWQYLLNNDYEGFYESELQKRREHNYPPFSHLALIRLSYPRDKEAGEEELGEFASKVRQCAEHFSLELLGPARAPLSLLRGRKRFQCLIKAGSWTSIRELYMAALRESHIRHLRVSLDLDPVNML